ncbi:MAG: hypothetical protein ACK5MR_12670 [Cumulibacter sp.]
MMNAVNVGTDKRDFASGDSYESLGTDNLESGSGYNFSMEDRGYFIQETGGDYNKAYGLGIGLDIHI